MARYLRAQGWTVEHSTGTARGEHGPDIVARRDGELLQAKHWFAEALTSTILRRSHNSEAQFALAIPDLAQYRTLIEKSGWPLHRLEISVYLVGEDGAVERHGLG